MYRSVNYSTAVWVTEQLNIHLDDIVSTKPVWRKLHKSNIHGRAAIAKLWLLKVIVRCVNYGVTTITPGHQTTGNTRVIQSDESSFTLFPTSGRVYIWRTPKEAYNSKFLVPTVKHRRGSVMVWAAISWYSVGPVIILHDRIAAREYENRLGNQVRPMI
jgi:hypothetical protein